MGHKSFLKSGNPIYSNFFYGNSNLLVGNQTTFWVVCTDCCHSKTFPDILSGFTNSKLMGDCNTKIEAIITVSIKIALKTIDTKNVPIGM